MATVMPNKPANYRLPQWALDFIEREAQERRQTRTQIVIEAIECLRARELAALMREGYREMADEALDMAENNLPSAAETLPEW